MRVRNQYTDEFRTEAVQLVREPGRSLRGVAEALGVSHWTLRDWYRRDEMTRRSKARPPTSAAPAQETAEQKARRLEREVDLLRKEIDALRVDREILKKAAAFFAKENA
jgi:transposase-like protein